MNIALISVFMFVLMLNSIKGCGDGSDSTATGDPWDKKESYDGSVLPSTKFFIRAMVYNQYITNPNFSPMIGFYGNTNDGTEDWDHRREAVCDGLGMIGVTPYVIGYNEPGHNYYFLHENTNPDDFISEYTASNMDVVPMNGTKKFNEGPWIPGTYPERFYKTQCYVFMAKNFTSPSQYIPGDMISTTLGWTQEYSTGEKNYQPAIFIFIERVKEALYYNNLNSQEEMNFWLAAVLMHEFVHLSGEEHRFEPSDDKLQCSDLNHTLYVDQGACIFCRDTHNPNKDEDWVNNTLFGEYKIGAIAPYTRKWWCQWHARNINTIIHVINEEEGI
ncbi:MAG: hypothetical protein KFH87_12740 [Bacteroidetes bacterium]|nr:hypothetical protein [Bacteroidota bacterium]